ncbi:hypothetical protein EV193_10697 [Herbihabitans rhizosphaerae]|uniref:Uncharacterized protein n=1 Tax=Herbihabitans rhizosphaerae TaxID=1872711 RepID=A0A4V2ESA2_9PSEU|nr:hypothetical protein [Herbihabitans rhizosphaerae]RZS36863.1 hypothetical protein EV193_10697 [Herbihabitans rhizosphaerae]
MASRIAVQKSGYKGVHRSYSGVAAADLLAREGREPVRDASRAHAAAGRGAIAAATGALVVAGALSVAWSGDGQQGEPLASGEGFSSVVGSESPVMVTHEPLDEPAQVAVTEPVAPPVAALAVAQEAAPVKAPAPKPRPVTQQAPAPKAPVKSQVDQYRQYIPGPALAMIDSYNAAWRR